MKVIGIKLSRAGASSVTLAIIELEMKTFRGSMFAVDTWTLIQI